MPPAIIAAGVAAVGTIGGALIASHSSNKAVSQANDAQQAAVQAQLQLGQQSLQLNKDIYNSNFGLLSPFVSNGLVASNSLNALLGLPPAPKIASPLAAAPATGGTTTAPSTSGNQAQWAQGAINAMAPNITRSSTWAVANGISDPVAKLNYLLSQSPASSDQYPLYQAYVASHPQPTQTPQAQQTPTAATTPSLSRPLRSDYRQDAQGFRDASAAYRAQHNGTAAPSTPATGAGGAAGGTTAAINPQKAFENFANSAGMQFQLKQGTNAINNLYAAKGALQSGAAMKAISNYGQQTALNNYFMPYMGLLSGQQNMGVGAGSAIAGVGSNFGNTAAGIYNGMGSSIGAGADAASNAALLRGQNQAALWNSIGSGLGGLASSFFKTPVKY